MLGRFHTWVSEPGSPVQLAWFRIAVSTFCLAKLWAIRGSILDVYGPSVWEGFATKKD